jgi:hypothetical protein
VKRVADVGNCFFRDRAVLLVITLCSDILLLMQNSVMLC